MRIFNFFNKPKQTLSVEDKLKSLIENTPENYYSESQYKNFIGFAEAGEYELALNSLIELSKETNHYFSNDYWNVIIEIAEYLNLISVKKSAEKQIKRNHKDISWKLPLGITTNKVNETLYQSFTSKVVSDKWKEKRRKEDNVGNLVNQNGIHYKPKGRNGHFYAVENGKIAEVEYEIDLNGLLLFFRNTNSWFYPVEIELQPTEKEKIKADIEEWSKKTKNNLVFD